MKNRFKVSLLVFLIVILGCFTSVFADTTNDGAEIGTVNFNNTTENSAEVGNQLLQPEIGWKRYNDDNNNISYIGSWKNDNNAGTYKQTHHFSNMPTQIEFNFTGNKLRIIGHVYNQHYSSNIQVYIDGKYITNYSEYKENIEVYQIVLFSSKELSNDEHYVKIESLDEGQNLDAIDIDQSAQLKLYNTSLSVKASNININKTTTSLTVGQSDNLKATVTPDDATNKTVIWMSSDTSVATVDSNGKVTAIKKGTATITATTQDGSNLSSSCTVNVTEPTTISLDKTNDSINVGQTDNITATVNPSNVGVTWSSNNNSIVIVDSSGKITGLKEGQTIITATTADGKTATCTVNVIAQQVTEVKLTLYMNDSTTRKFDLTQDEFNDFMNWYTNMSEEVKGTIPYYIFNIPAQGTTPAQKHCVPFAKIESFEFE